MSVLDILVTFALPVMGSVSVYVAFRRRRNKGRDLPKV